MKLKTKTPCCGVPATVEDKPKQDRRCRKCHHWWRVDAELMHQQPLGQGRGIQSFHRLTWTFIGKL